MTVHFDTDGVYAALADLDRSCYIVRARGRVGACATPAPGTEILAVAPAMPPHRLGSPAFLRHHGVRHPYMAGSMAGGISSTRLVTALARAGHLASFGAAGLPPDRLDEALGALSRSLGDLPFAANLIHTPRDHRGERAVVDLLLRHRVRCAEASAFTSLSPELVRYRLAGLRPDPRSGVRVENRVVAKVSRAEIAELFLRPVPEPFVAELLAAGDITPEQARLARDVPLADDITVEADSAGHTDRRPLSVLVPQMLRLREQIAADVRIGAAGSIGTPQAVHAAFALGADYVVTGSVNQACVEAGTSPEVKRLLAQAGPTDCALAPSAFMFEAGATVQVLKKGTLFAQRADRLYRLYREYNGIDDLPEIELDRLLANVFPNGLDRAWAEVEAYLRDHEPAELGRAESDGRHRMALLFRSYLGMSSRWAAAGDETRSSDYQIWCGPAMGAFNLWTRSTALEEPGNRHVAEVAGHLLRGAAFYARLAQLRFAGVRIPAECADYRLPPVHQPADAHR